MYSKNYPRIIKKQALPFYWDDSSMRNGPRPSSGFSFCGILPRRVETNGDGELVEEVLRLLKPTFWGPFKDYCVVFGECPEAIGQSLRLRKQLPLIALIRLWFS